MTQLEMAQKAEIEKLTAQNELMRLLVTKKGFYHYYFSKLNEYPSNEDCFNACNELYHNLFGEYRYSSIVSFRVSNTRKK